MTPAAVEVTNVSKAFAIPHEQRTTFKEYFLHPLSRMSFERNEVLKEVSFAIEEGEFFGVMGPNGSGKSTLLKIMAGIYQPDAGVARVRGQLSPFIELGVGFNFELNARDNIWINATLLGLTRREVRGKFDDILEFAELERFVDQKLKNYSSGMLVRLAFSISTLAPFDILLLDEVLAVGDQSFQQKCYDTFEGMRRDGKTVVYVSHELESVRLFCDRALLLRDGRVETVGDAGAVVDTYSVVDTVTT